MSRILDSIAVLTGRKIAMDASVPGLILETISAAHRVWRAQTQIKLTNMPEDPATSPPPSPTSHDLAVSRLMRTKSYLNALVPLLATVGGLLEQARAAAGAGSAERKALTDQIAELKANANELDALISDTASATDAADAADDALSEPTPTPEPTPDPVPDDPVAPV